MRRIWRRIVSTIWTYRAIGAFTAQERHPLGTRQRKRADKRVERLYL
jgi:hypothetical protein